jgi:hypothetical protein
MVPLLLIAALFASLPLSENKFVACSQEPFRIWLDDVRNALDVPHHSIKMRQYYLIATKFV